MIRFGLIIEGDSFLTWYGREISFREKEELVRQYGGEGHVELLDFCQDSFSGFPVGQDPKTSSGHIRMFYFFPDEENPASLGPDRSVDLSQANCRIKVVRRKRSEDGFVYAASGEMSERQTMAFLFDSGFLPPFKPDDVTLVLDDISDFGFKMYVLTGVEYRLKPADYVESVFRFGRKLETVFQSD